MDSLRLIVQFKSTHLHIEIIPWSQWKCRLKITTHKMTHHLTLKTAVFLIQRETHYCSLTHTMKMKTQCSIFFLFCYFHSLLTAFYILFLLIRERSMHSRNRCTHWSTFIKNVWHISNISKFWNEPTSVKLNYFVRLLNHCFCRSMHFCSLSEIICELNLTFNTI